MYLPDVCWRLCWRSAIFHAETFSLVLPTPRAAWGRNNTSMCTKHKRNVSHVISYWQQKPKVDIAQTIMKTGNETKSQETHTHARSQKHWDKIFKKIIKPGCTISFRLLLGHHSHTFERSTESWCSTVTSYPLSNLLIEKASHSSTDSKSGQEKISLIS